MEGNVATPEEQIPGNDAPQSLCPSKDLINVRQLALSLASNSTVLGAGTTPIPSPKCDSAFTRPTALEKVIGACDAKECEDVSQDEIDVGKNVCIDVTIYDCATPTKSSLLRFPVQAPLFDLIDAILCSANLVKTVKGCCKTGGILYVEGVIYEDKRFSNADYSSSIARFLRSCGKDVRVVSLSDQECFLDLSVTLGAPYVFMHNGDCEHIIVFTTLYKACGTDSEMKVLWRRKPRVYPCDVCKQHFAVKFTLGDPMAERSPFHYCQHCYELAHYTQNNKRTLFRGRAGQFLVYTHSIPF